MSSVVSLVLAIRELFEANDVEMNFNIFYYRSASPSQATNDYRVHGVYKLREGLRCGALINIVKYRRVCIF
jgi:hypothetical protein